MFLHLHNLFYRDCKLISSLFSRQLCYRGWAICKLRHSLIDGDREIRHVSINVPTSRKGCGDSVYIGSTKIIPTGVSDINRLKRIVFILLQFELSGSIRLVLVLKVIVSHIIIIMFITN